VSWGLRGLGFEAESGLGENSPMSDPYWMRLSRFFMMVASLSGVAQADRLPRLVPHVRPGALDRIKIRSAGG
jgi:hypothetical protein